MDCFILMADNMQMLQVKCVSTNGLIDVIWGCWQIGKRLFHLGHYVIEM